MSFQHQQQRASLFVKKPTHLIHSFSQIQSATLPKKSSIESFDDSPSPTSISPGGILRKPSYLKMPQGKSFSPEPEPHSPMRGNTLKKNESQSSLAMIENSEDNDRRSTIKFGKVMQLHKISNEEKTEESLDRFKLAVKYLKELREIRLWEDLEGRAFTKKKSQEESEKIIKLAENIFGILNIQFKEIYETISDSSLTFFAVEDRIELATFFQHFAPELCSLPFAFLSKLKVSVLTVCGEVCLYKPSSAAILEQKIRNGLFVLKDLQNAEAVHDWWFKIVVCHLVKAEPKILEEYKVFIQEEMSSPTKKREGKSEVDDLINVFKYVMQPFDSPKTKSSRTEMKAKFLKKQLKYFEPVLFDESWWDLKHKETKEYQFFH